ncbi:unnamed protein product [Prunus armeniaca]|uniref:F-box domain-containing protein n=1 Tax=Prunus armeniaca TaxID=36596 RepID=A0A6J5XWN3_PRUAR|nr:unnamed protein product [Prunus armeniaca]
MMTFSSKVENVEERDSLSLLDLPDLTLECILEKLSPSGLCTMGGVCTSLRERCRDDRLWERHMMEKWGRLIGAAAYREWQLHVASRSRVRNISDQTKKKARTSLPVESVMSLYLSLESGKFWFPAQVYNRENGNVGFMLSCYDAQVSYDSRTNTFQARYSPYGRRATEDNIPWDRLRAAPVDTPSLSFMSLIVGGMVSLVTWSCVMGMRIAAVVTTVLLTKTYSSSTDTVTLEFSQYTPGSRWRQVTINRKDHREEGDEADGFYGGIRKLYNEEEIARWKRLWPSQVLE